jgi:hypothetical protein
MLTIGVSLLRKKKPEILKHETFINSFAMLEALSDTVYVSETFWQKNKQVF